MSNFLTIYPTKNDAELGTNPVVMPTPSYSSAKQTASTIVNSGRSAMDGKIIGQRIMSRDLVKLELGWAYLTASQWSDILKEILKGRGGFYVYIKYFDMTENDWRCLEFYPSDRTATPFKLDPTSKEILSWLDCKINFIDTGGEEVSISS